jgi:hypothetical protein
MWFTYTDDIFVVWPHGLERLQELNIAHFIMSADVQFTVYNAGHSTPRSSSPANISLISIRLMLHFLLLITLYLYTTVIHYIYFLCHSSSSFSLISSLLSLFLTALSHFCLYLIRYWVTGIYSLHQQSQTTYTGFCQMS